MTLAVTQQKGSSAESVLDRLERVVCRADDFVLGFVKCNHRRQRDEMRAALLARLPEKRVLEIELNAPVVSLLDEITARWDAAGPPDAVCVYGLEASINEQREDSPVLARLNNDRDLLRRSLPCALLLWLPDFALDLVARGAPDFWAWRSGVYEFPTESASWQRDSAAVLVSDALTLYSLPFDEKQNEITRLEELLRTARALPRQGKPEQETINRLVEQLALLHDSLGERSKAQTLFEQSLQIARELNDEYSIGRTLHNLATIYQDRDLAEAERLYEQSLHIARRLGDKVGVGITLHHLGNVQQNRGYLDKAVRLYEQSLQVAKEWGDKQGVAVVLHNLAAVQQEQGDFNEAIRLYEQSLQAARELGDTNGVASTLHQLGQIYHEQGDLAEAIRLYEQSLQINQVLGDKSGIAITLWQIGRLRQEQGQPREELQNYVAAWGLLGELQSRYAEAAQQDIQKVREQVGEEKFVAWLTEDFGKEAREILAALNAGEPK